MNQEQEGLKFYRCNTCGNLFLVMIDPDVIPTCCGQGMHILQENHDKASPEKHIPIIELGESGDYRTRRDANAPCDSLNFFRCRKAETIVRVGMQTHPMAPEHRIEWIALTDGERVEIQKLGLTTEPVAHFSMIGDKTKLRAYAFCNLHGLWSSEK